MVAIRKQERKHLSRAEQPTSSPQTLEEDRWFLFHFYRKAIYPIMWYFYPLVSTLRTNLVGTFTYKKAHRASPFYLRHGSNERDSSSSTARSGPVILSEAKDLAADRDRPFASLRVTLCDCSNCQVQFVQIEPCLSIIDYLELAWL
jgi:hypothetical protein